MTYLVNNNAFSFFVSALRCYLTKSSWSDDDVRNFACRFHCFLSMLCSSGDAA